VKWNGWDELGRRGVGKIVGKWDILVCGLEGGDRGGSWRAKGKSELDL
jgi:hypothetical protein